MNDGADTPAGAGGDIFRLLPQAAAKVAAVGRERRADPAAGGFAYRGVDDLLGAVHGPLTDLGITYWPTVVAVDIERMTTSGNKAIRLASVTVDQTFAAPDGSRVVIRMVGEGADGLDKAVAKAITSALKSTLIAVFTIPAADVADLDAPSADTVAAPRQAAAARPSAAAGPQGGAVANITRWLAENDLTWSSPAVAAVLLADPDAIAEHGADAPLAVWWRDNAGTPAKFKAAVQAEQGPTGAVSAGA